MVHRERIKNTPFFVYVSYETRRICIDYDPIKEGIPGEIERRFEFKENQETECIVKLTELGFDWESSLAELLQWFFHDMKEISNG